ncbi:phage BR0599 family protein [Humisphaera borealis]|uniref:Phage BR0599 family protein n=1 Tax=Humisphaera borealis TaxID=2807512 RepID=A0A7M2WYV4_9BACT|nr:phage BR0599 family protein [Humisphaera borealis]
MTSGAAALQHAPFHRYQSIGGTHRIYLRYPLRVAPAEGDGVSIRRGCRKTLSDCEARQGDTDQFGGFPNTPYGLVKPKKTDHT